MNFLDLKIEIVHLVNPDNPVKKFISELRIFSLKHTTALFQAQKIYE